MTTVGVACNILAQNVSVFASTLVYGLYLGLNVVGLYIFQRSNKGAHLSFIVLGVAALMFMMTSALWIAQVIGAIIYTRAYLMVTGDQLAKALNSVDVITKVQHCIFGTSIAFGDSLVVWRAWTIFPENKIIKISTVILLLTTTVMGALSEGFLESKSLIVRRHNGLQTAALSLSIATNLICTGMIAWKAWNHHLLVKTAGGTSNAQISVARVLTLVVESGCAYSIIQVCFAVVDTITPSGDACAAKNFATEIAVFVLTLIPGMYPVFILIIVRLEKSVADLNTMAASQSQFSTIHFTPRESRRGRPEDSVFSAGAVTSIVERPADELVTPTAEKKAGAQDDLV